MVAANVIHLLDEPYKALAELDRVCRIGGKIIIPTYMNKNEKVKQADLLILWEKPERILKGSLPMIHIWSL